jgi:hypothetical protein
MTLKEMREQVQFWLGLQDVLGKDIMPGAYDETAIIPGLLHQGTIDLLARTRCTVRCVHLRLLPDQPTYTLDHDVLSLVEVGNGSRRRRRGERATGFTLIRSDILQLKPTPTEAGEVDVWAVRRPDAMTADTDSPSFEQFGAIPDEYQDAIVSYALWKAADYTDDAGSSQSERYRILYEGQDGNGGRLSQIRTSVNKRGTARAPRARVTGLTPVRSSSNWVG